LPGAARHGSYATSPAIPATSHELRHLPSLTPASSSRLQYRLYSQRSSRPHEEPSASTPCSPPRTSRFYTQRVSCRVD
jgi:hypothetical protein